MNQSKSNLVSSAEQILGYHFRKPSLLVHALTHDSYSNDTISNYERLEFIGDAALSLAMANYLNVTYPKLKLGDISMLRSANVCNDKLARVAVRHNIYPLVQINSPQLDKQVNKFIEAVKQGSENEIYGGTTKKAPKILADVVEAIAAAIYQDCNFNLDMMWEVVKRLLEPLITADSFKQPEPLITADSFKQPVTDLYQLCQKNGKVVQFKPSREGQKTIFEVLIDGEKVGSGSSKQKYIAKLNAARHALKKLNGKKSNLLIKPHKEVEDEGVKQKPFLEGNKACSVSPNRKERKTLTTALTQFCQKKGKVVEFKTSREGKSTIISEVLVDGEKVGYGSSKHKNIAKLNAARDALEKLNGEKYNLTIKAHKEVEDGEKSTLQAPTIPQSQHQLAALGPLPSLSFASPHETIETKEKKEYHSVELRPTRDERDKIEEVRIETAAKQKLNELCMKRHRPPPEYQSETKGMSTEGEKGKGEGHVADPPQHQQPKPTLSPVLTASAQPAPGNKACSVSPNRKERKTLTTALTQFCQKKGKVVKFKTSREGKSTTISEVFVDGEKVGYGSSKHKNIAKLNAARDALEKLNREKSNLLIKPHKEVEDKEAKQKLLLKTDVLQLSDLLTTALQHSPLSSDAESTHRFAPIKMDKDSILRASTIPHSQHQLVAFSSLPPISFSSLHEKIETREKKEYHSVVLRHTRDEKDKIEEVRKEKAAKRKLNAKQKLNELCMRKHCPPPEYQSETKGMSAEGEKGKREGHVADPLQHQHLKPALSLGLTASAQPAPESEESTEYEELEESTESKESQESEESTESKKSIESEESEEDIPYMDKVDSYQIQTGYNVTVEEGRERRERRVPCCRIDIGWLLFILGFILRGIPWCIGAIMLCFSRVDYRKKPGYIGCTIAVLVVLATIAGCIINNWSDKRS